MTEDEIREYRRTQGDREQHHIKIAVMFDGYELANVLRAIRTAPNDGDWYGQVLNKIDYSLRAMGFCLVENKDMGNNPYAALTFRVPPNTPYPEGFTTKYGFHQGKDPLE